MKFCPRSSAARPRARAERASPLGGIQMKRCRRGLKLNLTLTELPPFDIGPRWLYYNPGGIKHPPCNTYVASSSSMQTLGVVMCTIDFASSITFKPLVIIPHCTNRSPVSAIHAYSEQADADGWEKHLINEYFTTPSCNIAKQTPRTHPYP